MDFSAGFKLYADSSQFERGMARAASTAQEVGKKITSAFDGKAIGRTLATALGISLNDIADKVARFWLNFSKDQEAALESMVAATDKAAREQEKALDRLRIAKEKEHQQALDNAEDERQILLKAAEEGRKMVQENAEAQRNAADEANAITFKQWEDAQKINQTKEESIKLQRILNATTLKEAEIQAEKTRQAEKQLEIINQRLAREGMAKLATEDRLLVGGRWFGPSRTKESIESASADELRELIRRAQQDIAFIEENKGMSAVDVATGNFVQGSAIARLKTDIQRALYALDQRNSVSGDISRFGIDAARRNFTGDPLAFDSFMRQYVGETRDLKQIASETNRLLEEMNVRQKSGIPVVNLNGV